MDLKKLYIERAVYPAMTLLQHNRVNAYKRQLLESEFISPEQRAADLRQRVSELLFLCRSRVPAYSDLSFTDLEMRREPLDCLSAVDPSPMADFLAEPRHYLRRDLDPERLCCVCHGGDDRPEVRMYYTHEQIERYEAARWRGLSWYGVTYGSPSVLLWDHPRRTCFLHEEPYMKNRLSLSVCAMTDRSVLPTTEEIDHFNPEYLSGSASALAMLADGLQRTGISLKTPLKVVTVTQGVADEALRTKLADAFHCPVAQNLGYWTEGIIAYMCPEGHLHINQENCYVEILDPQTWAPVPPGHRGLVAVTDLVGQTMPHLRVVLDFMATMPDTPCPCGRTLPVLEGLEKMAPSE